LRFFYRPDNYLEFCHSVPLHLLPVFKQMATSPEYQADPHVRNWKPYYDRALTMMDEKRVLPIFMSKLEDRFNPALFKLEGSQIILNMVRDVTVNGRSPEEATETAMAKASSLLDDAPSSDSSSVWWWGGAVILLLFISIFVFIVRRHAVEVDRDVLLYGPAVCGLLVDSVHTDDGLGGESQFVGTGNFDAVFTDPAFRVALFATAAFTVTAVVTQVALGFCLAMLARREILGCRTMRAMIFAPYLLPIVVVVAAWRFVSDPFVGPLPAFCRAVIGVSPDFRGPDKGAFTGAIFD
jgi:hypothetical protein